MKRKVEIAISPGGYGTVLLDGVDVSANTQDITIRLRPGKPPEVDIRWVASSTDVTLSEAEVRDVVPIEPNPDLADLGRQIARALDAFQKWGGRIP